MLAYVVYFNKSTKTVEPLDIVITTGSNPVNDNIAPVILNPNLQEIYINNFRVTRAGEYKLKYYLSESGFIKKYHGNLLIYPSAKDFITKRWNAVYNELAVKLTNRKYLVEVNITERINNLNGRVEIVKELRFDCEKILIFYDYIVLNGKFIKIQPYSVEIENNNTVVLQQSSPYADFINEMIADYGNLYTYSEDNNAEFLNDVDFIVFTFNADVAYNDKTDLNFFENYAIENLKTGMGCLVNSKKIIRIIPQINLLNLLPVLNVFSNTIPTVENFNNIIIDSTNIQNANQLSFYLLNKEMDFNAAFLVLDFTDTTDNLSAIKTEFKNAGLNYNFDYTNNLGFIIVPGVIYNVANNSFKFAILDLIKEKILNLILSLNKQFNCKLYIAKRYDIFVFLHPMNTQNAPLLINALLQTKVIML